MKNRFVAVVVLLLVAVFVVRSQNSPTQTQRFPNSTMKT